MRDHGNLTHFRFAIYLTWIKCLDESEHSLCFTWAQPFVPLHPSVSVCLFGCLFCVPTGWRSLKQGAFCLCIFGCFDVCALFYCGAVRLWHFSVFIIIIIVRMLDSKSPCLCARYDLNCNICPVTGYYVSQAKIVSLQRGGYFWRAKKEANTRQDDMKG